MFPVAPSIAVTASSEVDAPTSKEEIFFPFITIIRSEEPAMASASSRCSFLLADTFSETVSLFASMNLEARTQLVQPLRW